VIAVNRDKGEIACDRQVAGKTEFGTARATAARAAGSRRSA
jgi:hypothetical protein